MNPRSAKAKGRRLQNFVKNTLLETFSSLEEDDIKTAIMGESGEDLHLSPNARSKIPFSIECKNVEKLNIWSALQQAELNAKPNTNPLVVFTRNRTKKYVALEYDVFLSLIKELSIDK